MPKIYYDEVIFEAPVTFNVCPRRTTAKVKGATPNFKNIEIAKFINTGATNCTAIKGGVNGQCVKVIGDGNTTVVHSTNLRTYTLADVLLVADTFYELTHIDGKWYLTQ